MKLTMPIWRRKSRQVDLEELLEQQKERGLVGAQFIPDPTPMQPPIGYKKQPSMMEVLRQQIREDLSREAAQRGHESFEEADDFDVGDDLDPHSPWENEFDPPISELVSEGQQAAQAKKPAPPTDGPAPTKPAEGRSEAPTPGPETEK